MATWLCIHNHRHGSDCFTVETPDDWTKDDVVAKLVATDPNTFGLETREDEYLYVQAYAGPIYVWSKK